MNRVTINYNTENNQYLYDDMTGNIYPWNDLREQILKRYNLKTIEEIKRELMQKYSKEDIDLETAYIEDLIIQHAAFFRTEMPDNNWQIPGLHQIKEMLSHINNTFVISLTDDCNMRCKYCIYSDAYFYTKNKKKKFIDTKTIMEGVNQYLDLVQGKLNKSPVAKFYISFYGGEPLLNISKLTEIIDYINLKFPNKFEYNITTNGLLLNECNIHKLFKRNVNVYISFDGPDEEHDRLRVNINGKGTYKTILNNIYLLKKLYPELYKEKVSLVSVYDFGTDLIKVEKYFEAMEEEDILPKVKLVNKVVENGTEYYNQFSKTQIERFYNMYKVLENKYFDSIKNNKKINSYLAALIATPYMMLLFRKREFDQAPDGIPLGGTCYPGQKLFLDTDGKYYICERTNGTINIGNIKTGIDIGKIQNSIKAYQTNILLYCNKCPITKICTNCFRSFEENGVYKYNSELCKNNIESVKQMLEKYSAVAEENPNVKFLSGINSENDMYEFVNL